MNHRSVATCSALFTLLLGANGIADPARDRNRGTAVPPAAARLIAGSAEFLRDEIDSGAIATDSGPRVGIKPVQILQGQGSINGDTITLASGPAMFKFDILFGGWGSTGQGLTTFQVTTQGTCVGGLHAGLACPPNYCLSGGGTCANTTGTGTPLDLPGSACADQAA